MEGERNLEWWATEIYYGGRRRCRTEGEVDVGYIFTDM
jgi:hypothetical protein